MELKELLGEELAVKASASPDAILKEVLVKLGGQKLVSDDGKMVPQYRVKEQSDLIEAQKAQIKKNDEDLKALKDKAAGNDTLTAQITDLQRVNKAAKDEFEASQLKAKKSFALKEALMNSGIGDPEARNLLSLRFDIDKLELDEAGKPKGFDEQLKPIKENKSFAGMFGTTVIVGQEHADGATPGQFYTREQVVAMTQAQVNANLEKVNKSMAQWK